jgi:hypothetical protein
MLLGYHAGVAVAAPRFGSGFPACFLFVASWGRRRFGAAANLLVIAQSADDFGFVLDIPALPAHSVPR